MPLLLVGLSHRNGELAARESLAVLPAPKVFARLRREGCSEAVIVSTCNRYELYLGLTEPKSAPWAVDLLEDLSGRSLGGAAYHKQGPAAVEHLFRVAAGLDSLVIGETEILGQVRGSYDAAKAAAMTGKYTNVLFQRALFVGKKVRSDTAIAVGQTSVASVAVQLAETIFGRLEQSSVLILGAGSMAELTARHLQSRKVRRLLIANRTYERARDLAGALKAEAVRWEDFPGALSDVDIVIASTGSERPVLTEGLILRAEGRRAGRSLFIIDIAMPRDVEEGVHELEHVYVYRLEHLESIVAENLNGRIEEVARAEEIVRAKALEFSAWEESLSAGREISLKHSEA